MRYVSREARDGINVSNVHPLTDAATLISALGLVLVGVLLVIVFLVDIVLYFVPAEKEAAFFDSWLPGDLVQVSQTDGRAAAVHELADRLLRNWPDPAYRPRIAIDDSAAVNAVALPGGLIVLSRGLLDRAESENELAFVIAHEFGHFENRDHLRGLGRGAAVTLLLGAIGASEGKAALGASIADLTLRGFSRRQESAADRFGLEIVAREYGHVAGATRFFERLAEAGGSSGAIVSYLSTHPASESRVDDLVATAGTNGWSVTGDTTALDW